MRNQTSIIQRLILLLLGIAFSTVVNAQQDPQYTQYMYNTMSVNPAYAGQRNVLSITGLHRSQWVGLEGAPSTQTVGVHAPLENDRIGLGLSIINDKLGPVKEATVNGVFSYTIPLRSDLKMSFGLNAGVHNLASDWEKGLYKDADRVFEQNVSLWSPTIGFGGYLHSDKWYVGLSVPNFITTSHYDDFQEAIAKERLHYFLIGGYVFDVGESLKLKPSALVKGVSGAPLIADISLNALFNDKLTVGLGWRWDDAISGLVGFQVNKKMFIGYAYDGTTTGLNNYSSGSHEIMLRFELVKAGRLISPRFF